MEKSVWTLSGSTEINRPEKVTVAMLSHYTQVNQVRKLVNYIVAVTSPPANGYVPKRSKRRGGVGQLLPHNCQNCRLFFGTSFRMYRKRPDLPSGLTSVRGRRCRHG
jgi:hypothetical protein